MTYTKNTWATGDTVTAAKLNNMEDGIAAAGALSVTVNSPAASPGGGTTLDKTYEEIVDAIDAGVPVVVKGLVNSAGHQERYIYAVSKTYIYDDQYRVAFYSFDRENTYQFGAATATGTLTLI